MKALVMALVLGLPLAACTQPEPRRDTGVSAAGTTAAPAKSPEKEKRDPY
jgi:hypothetical protein